MSKYYSIVAPAKLNLNLSVKDKTKDGLHLLESQVCFLELQDIITLKTNNEDVFFQNEKTDSFLIDPKENLILRAIEKFRSLTSWRKKFEVYLDKKIPIGAGLGGGSANAAATLILLRKIYNNCSYTKKVRLSNLHDISCELGSDVPACLRSQDLVLSGFGEKIKKNKISHEYFFLLVNPNIVMSTGEVFEHYSKSLNINIEKYTNYFDNIKIFNSLLPSAINLQPTIAKILNLLKQETNIISYGMTGSGSTCFGIFKNKVEITKFLKIYESDLATYFIWYGGKKEYKWSRVTISKTLENK